MPDLKLPAVIIPIIGIICIEYIFCVDFDGFLQW